jgi:periplasmic copper chaperone A
MAMNLMKNYSPLLLIIIILFSFPLFGGTFSVSTEDNIISKLRPGQKVTAGFLSIVASEDVKIINIEAKRIGSIEVHSMIMDGEIMKMRRITPKLLKNKKFTFKPGGKHLMLFDIKRDLKIGDDINLLFTFQLKNKKLLSKSIQFKVK